MRMLNMLSGFCLAFALASAASAGALYRWTNADGVVGFSDDLKRIPEAYRASAKVVRTPGLASYERYTPAQAAGTQGYRERLETHVARVRALNEDIAAARAAAAPQSAASSLGDVRVSRKLSIALPDDVRRSDAPVVVEEHRVRDGNTTTHVFVVRQGERVLSVMRPHTNQSGASWRDLDDVLGEK